MAERLFGATSSLLQPRARMSFGTGEKKESWLTTAGFIIGRLNTTQRQISVRGSIRTVMPSRPNQSAAANSRRAFRLRVAGDWTVALALHRRSPAAVAELG